MGRGARSIGVPAARLASTVLSISISISIKEPDRIWDLAPRPIHRAGVLVSSSIP